jgi:phosphoribosylaminoimidazole-succinocarboxamide synthase
MRDVVLNVELPGIRLYKKGKVRDVFDLDEHLLIVATDRISAFDCVLPNGIPDKGKVLTMLSAFWFDFTSEIVPNHLISTDVDNYPRNLREFSDLLSKRSMLVKRSEAIEIECVVRGYLSGSAWKDYKSTGEVAGIKLPKGLKESSKLPEPIFTPSIKARSGHDENITEKKMIDIIGESTGRTLKEKTMNIYRQASEYTEARGIIIADTKFEFGKLGNDIIVIDEMLTPDSSRFWPKDTYAPGKPQPSFDKQSVRDYLETLDWDKTPPAPKLPVEVVKKTAAKYLDAYKMITGREKL